MAVKALHGFSSRGQILEADQRVRLAWKHLDAVQRAELAKDSLQSALIWARGDVAQQQVAAGL